MKTLTIQLEQDDIKKVQSIEQSVVHYSIELGRIAVEEQKIKNTLVGLGEARYKLMESVLKSNGLDLAKVAGVQVNPKGQVQVEINDQPQPGPEGPIGPPEPDPQPVGANGPVGPENSSEAVPGPQTEPGPE